MSDDTKLLAQAMLKTEQLEAIGCLAIHSSMLEHDIDDAIWSLCHLPEEIGRIFTDGPQLAAKTDILRDIVNQRLKTKVAKEQFKKIYDRIKNELPDRNTAIHGAWYMDVYVSDPARPEDDWLMVPAARRIRHGQKTRVLEASKIMDVARRIANLNEELREFLKARADELSP